MNKIKLRVKRLNHFAGDLPKYESLGASGFDIRACTSDDIILKPLERVLVPTGLTFEIPIGFELQVRPRSGWAAKEGLTVLNTPGTIDADYRGEVKIIVINLGPESITIKPQDRVAQVVLCPVYQAEWQLSETLSETDRGAGGFGSTGH